MLWKKLARVKDCVNGQIVKFGGMLTGRYRIKMLHFYDTCQSWLRCGQTENWPCVLWKKLATVNECVIMQKFGGLPTVGERYGRWTLNFSDRSHPWLFCGQIRTGQVCCGKSWQGSKIVNGQIVIFGNAHGEGGME